MKERDLTTLPDNLPAPIDDGAAAHLSGLRVPSITLDATSGERVNLGQIRGWTALAAYPRTGVPGAPPIDPDWDLIPGARGCTPHLLGYQALCDAFRTRECNVYGLSVQDSAYQGEMVRRLGLRFPVLSDCALQLTHALKLPTHLIADQVLLRRLSLLISDAVIVHVEYPVFPSDQNAARMLKALAALQNERPA